MRSRDNITPVEGRDPALFVQPKSGGSGDCYVANHPGCDQDATEEAVYTKVKQVPPAVTRSMIEHRCDILSRASKRSAGKCACLGVKNIGKPYAGKPHVRFDEEGLVRLTMEWLMRHRQTKGAETDRQFLMVTKSQSFTLPFFLFFLFYVHKNSHTAI